MQRRRLGGFFSRVGAGSDSDSETASMNTLTTEEQVQVNRRRSRRNAIHPIHRTAPPTIAPTPDPTPAPTQLPTILQTERLPRIPSILSNITENTAGYGSNSTRNIGSDIVRTPSSSTLSSISSFRSEF